MRTLPKLPAAIPRSLLPLLLCSVCFALYPRPAYSEAPLVHADAPPVPFFSPFGPGRRQSNSPQAVRVASPPPLDPYSIPPEELGDLMMIHQRYLAAIEAYQRAPRSSAEVWNKLGMAYQHMYALDIAKLQYEKALQLNPRYAEAINNLGTVYYGERDYHKAEKYYHKAIRLKPNCAAFYSNLGTAYFTDRDYKHGIKAYRKAFSLDPEVFLSNPLQRVAEMAPPEQEAALNYALARLYAQAGMVEDAIHCLRVAYMDGFDDDNKLMRDKGFAALRKTPQFHLFMTEEHIKDPNQAEQESFFIEANSPRRR